MAYSLSNQHVAQLNSSVNIASRESLVKRFLNWCEGQQSNRFLWLACTFFLQIGLALPVAAYAIIFFGGNNFVLWILLVTVNVPTLVLNLAALPTRVTLPFLFFAWFTEALIILYAFASGLLF